MILDTCDMHSEKVGVTIDHMWITGTHAKCIVEMLCWNAWNIRRMEMLPKMVSIPCQLASPLHSHNRQTQTPGFLLDPALGSP